MKSKFPIIIIFSVLLLGLVSAHTIFGYDNHYKEKITETKYPIIKETVVSTTRYAYYDNDKRYSTYDYRYGYTYRESEKYWEDHYDRKGYRYNSRWDDYDNYVSRGKNDDYPEDHYRKYDSDKKKSRKVNCYNSPPKGKLFYIKC